MILAPNSRGSEREVDPAAMAARIFGATPMCGRHPDWHRLYELVPPERLPWHCPDLDPDLARELERVGLRRGHFLDIGAGSGHQAAALARRGFTVTGTDVSEAALAQARQVAADVAFVADDITATALVGPFDYAFDRGCLHVLSRIDRPLFAKAAAALVRPGGLLFLKCVSAEDDGPAAIGPERFTGGELAELFGGAFRLIRCMPTIFQGPLARQPKALFAVFQRRVG